MYVVLNEIPEILCRLPVNRGIPFSSSTALSTRMQIVHKSRRRDVPFVKFF